MALVSNPLLQRQREAERSRERPKCRRSCQHLQEGASREGWGIAEACISKATCRRWEGRRVESVRNQENISVEEIQGL